MLDVRVPDMRQGEPITAEAMYRVPLLALTHPSPLCISEATINLNVELIELEAAASETLAGRLPGLDTSHAKEVVLDSAPKEPGLHASITIRVAAADGPDGLHRLVNDLLKAQGVYRFLPPEPPAES